MVTGSSGISLAILCLTEVVLTAAVPGKFSTVMATCVPSENTLATENLATEKSESASVLRSLF